MNLVLVHRRDRHTSVNGGQTQQKIGQGIKINDLS